MPGAYRRHRRRRRTCASDAEGPIGPWSTGGLTCARVSGSLRCRQAGATTALAPSSRKPKARHGRFSSNSSPRGVLSRTLMRSSAHWSGIMTSRLSLAPGLFSRRATASAPARPWRSLASRARHTRASGTRWNMPCSASRSRVPALADLWRRRDEMDQRARQQAWGKKLRPQMLRSHLEAGNPDLADRWAQAYDTAIANGAHPTFAARERTRVVDEERESFRRVTFVSLRGDRALIEDCFRAVADCGHIALDLWRAAMPRPTTA